MTKSLKDKIKLQNRINWISCAISGIGLAIILIGISVGFVPIFLGRIGIMAIISAGLIVLFQIIIIVLMYLNISWGGIDQQALSTRSTTITLSIINLVFLLLGGFIFYAGPIISELLFLVPIITIIAGIIFKDYN